ncbi:MAG: OsmC family protein [Rhodothermales bacterium]
MSHVYTAAVRWTRSEGEAFIDNRYHRAHEWAFDGGVTVPASSSPSVVPLPMSDASAVDPEEAFVAALSSCHMLWFLSLAAKQRFVVERYEDAAEGIMQHDDAGRMAITHVWLQPTIVFSGERQPTPEQLAKLHHLAHDQCFIANSVKTVVDVREPAPDAH